MVLIRRVLGVALFVGLLVLGWKFASHNGDPVIVHYVFGVTESQPVWLVVMLACLMGLGLAGLFLGFVLLRDRVALRRLRKIVSGLEGELRDFRNIPVETEGIGVMEETSAGSPSPAGSSGAGGGS